MNKRHRLGLFDVNLTEASKRKILEIIEVEAARFFTDSVRVSISDDTIDGFELYLTTKVLDTPFGITHRFSDTEITILYLFRYNLGEQKFRESLNTVFKNCLGLLSETIFRKEDYLE